MPGRVRTGQSSAPPPSPAYPGSPATSVVGLDSDTSHPQEEELSEGKQQPLAPRPPSGPSHTTGRKSSPRFRTEVGGKGDMHEQGNVPSEEMCFDPDSNETEENESKMDEKKAPDSETTPDEKRELAS